MTFRENHKENGREKKLAVIFRISGLKNSGNAVAICDSQVVSYYNNKKSFF